MRLPRIFRRRPKPPHCGDVGAHQGPFRYEPATMSSLDGLACICERCGVKRFGVKPAWPKNTPGPLLSLDVQDDVVGYALTETDSDGRVLVRMCGTARIESDGDYFKREWFQDLPRDAREEGQQ